MTYKQDFSKKIVKFNLLYLFTIIKKSKYIKFDYIWSITLFLLFIIPFILNIFNELELSPIYYIFAIIMIIKYFIYFSEKIGLLEYEKEIKHYNNTLSNDFSRKYMRYTVSDMERDINGGLTNLEVKNRKKEIWKKLS